jgi:hypothetical protein
LSDQVKFASVQKLPLHLFARLQPNGCSQRHGEIDIELSLDISPLKVSIAPF